jgi:uncharacterized protein YndB with AHSA1/START domain
VYSVSLHIEIDAPAVKVFEALTRQELLSKWFAPQVIAVPVEGTVAAFAFEFDLNFKMEIVALQQNKQLRWICVDGYEAWLDSEIVFKLEEKALTTSLDFSHSKLINDDKKEKTVKSWNGYLEKLKELCESTIK